MAAFEGVIITNNSTDANFREWTEFVHNQLTGSGMTPVPTPGEMDFATVVKPVAGAEQTGYRIYSFSDSLQSTVPIYFRIAYGAGITAARPAIWPSLGFSIAQSGSIIHTGSVGDTFVTGSGSGLFIDEIQMGTDNSSTTAHSHSWSGNGGYVVGALWHSFTSADLLLSIERTKDALGVPDGRGVIMQRGWNIFGNSQVLYLSSSAIDPSIPGDLNFPTIHGTLNPSSFSGSAGHTIQISAVVATGQYQMEQVHNWVTSMPLDFGDHKDIFVTIKETTIPFRTLQSTFLQANCFTNIITQRIAIRFQE